MSRRLILPVAGAAAVIALAAILPQLITGSYYQNLAILAVLYATVALNWDLTIGYAGLFNFAHIAFFGLGAYTTGILTTKYSVSPWLGIGAAVALSVVVATIVAFPATRLRGIYVALTTFAFTALVSALIVSRTSLTGGAAGLVLIPSISIGGDDFGAHPAGYFYLAEALLIVSTVCLRLLVRSDFGLSFVAVREFEEYAASRGVPLARQRLVALVISAVFTSAAGAVYAHYLGVASPDVFGFGFNTLFLSMVIVGGAGTLYGPLLAAIVLTFFTESRQMASLGEIRFMIISVVIVLVLLFARRGLWGAVEAAARLLGWRNRSTLPSLADSGGQRAEAGAETGGEPLVGGTK
jgi:branched-chain amino acid transport system permease protein